MDDRAKLHELIEFRFGRHHNTCALASDILKAGFSRCGTDAAQAAELEDAQAELDLAIAAGHVRVEDIPGWWSAWADRRQEAIGE